MEFAVERPGRFAVMFRPEHLLTDDAAYRAASDAASGVLVDAVHALHPDRPVGDAMVVDAAIGAWSIVHGFATLWIDGNFGPSVAAPAGRGRRGRVRCVRRALVRRGKRRQR